LTWPKLAVDTLADGYWKDAQNEFVRFRKLPGAPAMRSFFCGRQREEIDLTKVRSTQANSGL
jgi:hypothetical protein